MLYKLQKKEKHYSLSKNNRFKVSIKHLIIFYQIKSNYNNYKLWLSFNLHKCALKIIKKRSYKIIS